MARLVSGRSGGHEEAALEHLNQCAFVASRCLQHLRALRRITCSRGDAGELKLFARVSDDVVKSIRMVPIFYSFRRCPYAMRARLALDASRQSCELREVSLRNKPDAMLEASPKGTVPVLIDTNGTVIDESLDIMLWALHRNDPEQWLVSGAHSIYDVQTFIRRFDTHFKQHLDRYKYPNRFEGASSELSRTEASNDLALLEERLRSARFLCGDRPTLADMAIAPFVRQFANVDAEWFDLQTWPGVHRWLSAIVSSERFGRIMRPMAPWFPGTKGVPFPLEA